MLTHDQIWCAIDRLANSFGYSPSGLAKQSGLDPTSFNKSKRHGPDGKPRWPSTESLSRVLAATGATMSDFIALVDEDQDNENNANNVLSMPTINLAKTKDKTVFDKNGFPLSEQWETIDFLNFNNQKYHAIKINNDSLSPTYRRDDILIISPQDKVSNGDRVIIKTQKGNITAKELVKQNVTQIEVRDFNNDVQENEIIPTQDIVWMNRISWVSQ